MSNFTGDDDDIWISIQDKEGFHVSSHVHLWDLYFRSKKDRGLGGSRGREGSVLTQANEAVFNLRTGEVGMQVFYS